MFQTFHCRKRLPKSKTLKLFIDIYAFVTTKPICVFFQKFISSPRFNNNFSQSNQFHTYNTENFQVYRLPYCRTNTKKF